MIDIESNEGRDERQMRERIDKLKEVARAGGYALTEHGTYRRDIDLVCVPWVAEAIEPIRLIETLRASCGAIITDLEVKPHGRIGVILQGYGPKMWDLSVFPPRG